MISCYGCGFYKRKKIGRQDRSFCTLLEQYFISPERSLCATVRETVVARQPFACPLCGAEIIQDETYYRYKHGRSFLCYACGKRVVRQFEERRLSAYDNGKIRHRPRQH